MPNVNLTGIERKQPKSRVKIKPGDVINCWTILEDLGVDHETTRHYFMAQCVCGSIKRVRMDNLVSGHTYSCGCTPRDTPCRWKETYQEPKIPNKGNHDFSQKDLEHIYDRSGTYKGALYIEQPDEGNKLSRFVTYQCECSCGNHESVREDVLDRNWRPSCKKCLARLLSIESRVKEFLVDNKIGYIARTTLEEVPKARFLFVGAQGDFVVRIREPWDKNKHPVKYQEEQEIERQIQDKLCANDIIYVPISYNARPETLNLSALKILTKN